MPAKVTSSTLLQHNSSCVYPLAKMGDDFPSVDRAQPSKHPSQVDAYWVSRCFLSLHNEIPVQCIYTRTHLHVSTGATRYLCDIYTRTHLHAVSRKMRFLHINRERVISKGGVSTLKIENPNCVRELSNCPARQLTKTTHGDKHAQRSREQERHRKRERARERERDRGGASERERERAFVCLFVCLVK